MGQVSQPCGHWDGLVGIGLGYARSFVITSARGEIVKSVTPYSKLAYCKAIESPRDGQTSGGVAPPTRPGARDEAYSNL